LEIVDLPLSGAKLIRPRLFKDDRGYFMELCHGPRYAEAGIGSAFVQDNFSYSKRAVVRGLHYQFPRWQGKLVMTLQGEIWDVIVDLRKGSPTFGKWHGLSLSARDHAQLWVPEGFAHGFCVISETAHVLYKCTALYDPAGEHSILPTDPEIGIEWPVKEPILSTKDAAGRRLRDAVLS